MGLPRLAKSDIGMEETFLSSLLDRCSVSALLDRAGGSVVKALSGSEV